MRYFVQIQKDFLKYAAKGDDAKIMLQKAIKRRDREAIDYWLKVLARDAREESPIINLTDKEFKNLKNQDSFKDKIEIDDVKEQVVLKIENELNVKLPKFNAKPLQDISVIDEEYVLKKNNGQIPRYAFVVNGTIYLNVEAVKKDKEYTGGTLQDVMNHELGHYMFNKYKRRIIELMDKYELVDDYNEDFAELFRYGMTDRFKKSDSNLKMYKIFHEFKQMVKK